MNRKWYVLFIVHDLIVCYQNIDLEPKSEFTECGLTSEMECTKANGNQNKICHFGRFFAYYKYNN